MMMMLIKKNPSTPFFFFIHKTIPISNLFNFSFSSASLDQNPPPKSNFITEYLINLCGFSPQKASAASKHITYITSPSKPDSVRHFLKHLGFTDTCIRSIISGYPFILNANVNQTMEPNLQALRRMGFAEHELRKLIVRNPQALLLCSTIPRIEFWKTLLNGDMKKLLSAFRRNGRLINLDIDKNVIPKITLLKDNGLSESQIEMLIHQSGIIGRSINSMEVLVKRAQEMGFQLGSKMFVHGLNMLTRVGPDPFMARMELFRGFGWSEEEFLAAVQKFPYFINLSEGHIREKMEFLVGRAGCTQSYIASCPMILNYSLVKRLIPRHHMIKILRSHILTGKEWDLFNIICLSEKKFVERFILRYKDEVPTLLETYNAACAGEIPL